MPLHVRNNIISSNDITNVGVLRSKVNRDGIVIYLDAGDVDSYPRSGTTWFDKSGNGFNGTLFNGVTFSNESGGVLIFNGTNQFMQANINNTSLDGDPRMTVEMMVKRTSSFQFGGFWGVGGAGQGFSIQGWTPIANRIHLDLYDSTRLDTGVDYPLNNYVHVAWVKHNNSVDPNTMICYINGVGYGGNGLTLGRATTTGPRLNTSTSGVGVSLGRITGNENANYAPITIGYFRVYNRALSGYEVFENFQSTRGRFGL